MSQLVFLLFLLENLFCESFLIIRCTLDYKINETILVDIYATKFGFIDKKFAKIICQIFEIEPQRLTKLKLI